jgi:hypothetical protein
MGAGPSVGFPETVFPVLAVERNLRRFVPAAAMPRVLTSDQWADYLIFRLYPQQRVFFDGRSDFFGPAIGSDYRKLLAGERPWRELLDRYRFDLALLPLDWALSTALDREPEWRLVYQDSVAVLYARDAGRTPRSARVPLDPPLADQLEAAPDQRRSTPMKAGYSSAFFRVQRRLTEAAGPRFLQRSWDGGPI